MFKLRSDAGSVAPRRYDAQQPTEAAAFGQTFVGLIGASTLIGLRLAGVTGGTHSALQG